jgi:hypothetical protein
LGSPASTPIMYVLRPSRIVSKCVPSAVMPRASLAGAGRVSGYVSARCWT